VRVQKGGDQLAEPSSVLSLSLALSPPSPGQLPQLPANEVVAKAAKARAVTVMVNRFFIEDRTIGRFGRMRNRFFVPWQSGKKESGPRRSRFCDQFAGLVQLCAPSSAFSLSLAFSPLTGHPPHPLPSAKVVEEKAATVMTATARVRNVFIKGDMTRRSVRMFNLFRPRGCRSGGRRGLHFCPLLRLERRGLGFGRCRFRENGVHLGRDLHSGRLIPTQKRLWTLIVGWIAMSPSRLPE
jgi:hypothetical protein